jgi:cytoskeletal protein CcmA (bactofilin family)
MPSSNLIPSAMRIHGRVTVDGDLVLEGSFTGVLIVSGSFTLAAGAQCQASVQARTAHVHGALTGALTGSDYIVVGRGARVLGDLIAPAIDVDPAAQITGELIRGSEPAPAGAAPASWSAPAAANVRAPAPAIHSAPRGRITVELRGPALRRPVPPGDPTERQARLFASRRRPDDRPVPKTPRLRGRVALVRKSTARTDDAGATA